MGDADDKEKILATRLRQRRFDLRARQKVIAALAGVSSKTLSKLENGEYSTVNPDILPALAEALNTTTDYLLGHAATPERVHGSAVAVA